jgi:hypothetical protein
VPESSSHLNHEVSRTERWSHSPRGR